ncbi:MAG: B12-binding domain-containing radical SAM protein [Candidatus Brocadiales bacterium]
MNYMLQDEPDIILVAPFPGNIKGVSETTLLPPIGLAYIAAVLENEGFRCGVIDANVLKKDANMVVEDILRSKPKAVGITANLFTGNACIEIAEKLKSACHEAPKIIVGGPFPTSFPQKFLQEGKADVVVIGEGELTMLEIMHNLRRGQCNNFSGINGVAYAENGTIIRTEQRKRIKDLDSLPIPAWYMLPDLNLYKSRARKTPVAPILTSRGCPSQCVYCSKDVFLSNFTARSPQNVLSEIDYLVKELNVKQIDILDDNFSLIRKRTVEILDGIIERNYNLAINLQLGVRVDSLDENIIKKMKKAGVFKIAFGVESGDERVLKNCRKGISLSKVLEATRLAKDSGMIVYGFFMFGLPGDNAQTMQKTIDFAIKMNPTIANFTITVPFPGTRLFEMVQREGRFLVDTTSGLDMGFYSGEAFYELGSLSKEDVAKYYQKAYQDFYYRSSKMLELLFSVQSLTEFLWIAKTSLFMLGSLHKKILDR